MGSRTAIFIAFVPYLGGLGALFFVTQWWQVLISYMFIMTGRYTIMTAGVALEGALVDDNERLTGTRKTGSFASLRALLSAPLIGTQTTLFMWIIAAYGYDQTATVQSESAQWGSGSRRRGADHPRPARHHRVAVSALQPAGGGRDQRVLTVPPGRGTAFRVGGDGGERAMTRNRKARSCRRAPRG
ncbi:hypothetical protein G7085_15190 [Tessaracoccus sp. HDW20]|nr:hypothetical protein [Tessaracoccus coleopterorum]